LIRQAQPGDVEAVVRIFRESRAEAWVYELDGHVVGFAVVHEADLDALYVAPQAQRRGVGSALFRRAQEARPDGFFWWVFRDNTRARRFYEALGGRCLYETDGVGNEEKTPDARYEWRPSPGPAAG
jgi:ribosomal protein S18 acetylase RimI-like enzyme